MLVEQNCVKTALNTAGLTLLADSGESFLIKAIYVGEVTTAGYLNVKVDNTTVACYRVAGKRGNELGGMRYLYEGMNVMKILVDKGLPFAIPIAEGQKLTLPILDGEGYLQVVYDRYTAGDIRDDMPNGTKAKRYGFIQYLDASAVITESGDMLLDVSESPAEYPNFPAGRVVPPKMSITILGISGSPFADAASLNNCFYTKYLKLIRDRNVLFDEDRNGILFLGTDGATAAGNRKNGVSIIGSCGEVSVSQNYYQIKPPFMFETPLKFESGEELLVYLTLVKVGTHTLPADLPDIGLIMQVDRE